MYSDYFLNYFFIKLVLNIPHWYIKKAKKNKKNSQTKIYSDTFNISHIISHFIRYSLENSNKIWQEIKSYTVLEQIHLDNVR